MWSRRPAPNDLICGYGWRDVDLHSHERCRLVRLSLAARDLIEVLEVGGAEGPRSRKTDGLIGEDLGQGGKEIARDLD